MESQCAGYTIAWDACDQAVIDRHSPGDPGGSDLCHFPDNARPSPGAWIYLYEALPQYEMWYLSFPSSLTGFWPLGRPWSTVPPEGPIMLAFPVYLPFAGRERQTSCGVHLGKGDDIGVSVPRTFISLNRNHQSAIALPKRYK